MAIDTSTLLFSCLLLAFALYKVSRIGSREKLLPPGPPTVPLLGNLLDLPPKNGHLKFAELAREYGNIVSLKLFNKTMVILNDSKTVRDLMDLRAKTSSARPPAYVTAEYITGGKHMLLADGQTSSLMKRTIYQSALTPAAVSSYTTLQEGEATAVLHNILERPDEFYQEMRRYSASLTLSFAFGKRAPTFDQADRSGFSLKRFYEASLKFNHMLEPGATPPMDLLPWIKKLPNFMQTWRKEADWIKAEMHDLYINCLFEELKIRVAQGRANDCWMETVLRQMKAGELPFDPDTIAWQGGIMLEGGSDTTSSGLLSIILAAVLHPEKVARCQAEIDAVTNGAERSPTLADIQKLPYTSAFLLEVQRWRPTANAGVPHYTTQDEEYNGYKIPAGTILIQNTWGILHDQRIYESPEEFIPERFLQHPQGIRPGLIEEGFRNTLGFGSGRRVCGGIKLAQNSMDTVIPKLFWAFNFAQAVDANGQSIAVSADDYIPGHLTAPQPFKCSITPRSAAHVETIKRDFEEEHSFYEKYSPY